MLYKSKFQFQFQYLAFKNLTMSSGFLGDHPAGKWTFKYLCFCVFLYMSPCKKPTFTSLILPMCVCLLQYIKFILFHKFDPFYLSLYMSEFMSCLCVPVRVSCCQRWVSRVLHSLPARWHCGRQNTWANRCSSIRFTATTTRKCLLPININSTLYADVTST